MMAILEAFNRKERVVVAIAFQKLLYMYCFVNISDSTRQLFL